MRFALQPSLFIISLSLALPLQAGGAMEAFMIKTGFYDK